MPEKRRARTKGDQAKVKRTATQATLKDLFQRTSSITGPIEKAQDVRSEYRVPVTPPAQVTDPHPPTQPSTRPKPNQVYPIFTRACLSRPRETAICVDDTEIIDITDVSSELDLSTEAVSSTQPLSPRSKSSRATSHSPPPSPIALDFHCCESATSLPHAGAQERRHQSKESSKRTPGLGDVAPFPSSCSQHVRGLQHSYTCSQVPVKRSVSPSSHLSSEGSLDFLKKCLELDDVPLTPLDHGCRSLTSQQCEEDLQSLILDHAESHPAFSGIAIHQERNSSPYTETWARRFRPRCANEVLGNEQHAVYLRDWLCALALQLRGRPAEEPASKGATRREKHSLKQVEPRGTKRPRVIRAVTRRRGNKKRRVDSDDDLDDFVVFSDADEEQTEDPPEESEDELAFCQRTLSRLHRRDTEDVHQIAPAIPAPRSEEPRTDFGDNLTNTILLTGPPGCGKTAAVYACAEELGWEIFEVYPGIGRRSGANLEQLIGDVGRNHIVQTVNRRAPTKTAKLEAKPMGLRGYLGKSRTGQDGEVAETQEVGTRDQPIVVESEVSRSAEGGMDVADEADISEMCRGCDGSKGQVGQSLVLLEEVDVLFKEDGGFWPAVIEFIRWSQRPVVMTCNDPGLVPVRDLPLQKVLVFEPCPSMVAARFLECLSLKEGMHVPHQDLMALYESTQWIDGIEEPEGPFYPRTGPLALPDLRRSITELQMKCAGARHGSTSEKQQDDEAGGHVRRSGRAISAECRDTPVGSTVEEEWWREMRSRSEVMSHVDAELCRSDMAKWEGVHAGGEEEGVGYVALSGEREGPACDELIAKEAIRYSRGIHGGATGAIEASINPAARLTREGFRARVEYQSRMEYALQGIVEPPAVMSQGKVYLDYLPWVRYMVSVDDTLALRTGLGGKRRTVNSRRAGHVRTITLTEGRLGALRESRLGIM